MSTGTNNTQRIGLLPPELNLPYEDERLQIDLINERERQTGTIVNQKENSVYTFTELLTAQQWFFDPRRQLDGFRRMYEVPSLVAGGSVRISHDLGDISGYTFTDYKGWVQNADGTSFRPLPADFIELTTTDIVLTVPAASLYNGLSGQIVLEYVKE